MLSSQSIVDLAIEGIIRPRKVDPITKYCLDLFWNSGVITKREYVNRINYVSMKEVYIRPHISHPFPGIHQVSLSYATYRVYKLL